MTVHIESDTASRMLTIVAELEKELDPYANISMVKEAIHEIAKAYAEEWIIDNLDTIYKHLNAEAVANAILVEVAKNMAERTAPTDKKN